MKNPQRKNTNNNSFFKSLLAKISELFMKLFPKKSGMTLQYIKNLKLDSLKLFGAKKKRLDEVNKEAGDILKQHFNDVNGLLKFIELRGTRVIRHKNVGIVLKFFGELEGFITPVSGIRGKLFLIGLKLVGAWNDPIYNKTPPMFIFGKNPPPMGYMVHQIHHWISFNRGLPGYSEETINNFKRIFDPNFGYDDIQNMTKEEMLDLREAISRDQEALEFVTKMAQELLAPQEVIKGLQEGKNKNI